MAQADPNETLGKLRSGYRTEIIPRDFDKQGTVLVDVRTRHRGGRHTKVHVLHRIVGQNANVDGEAVRTVRTRFRKSCSVIGAVEHVESYAGIVRQLHDEERSAESTRTGVVE